jgi:hypothetical protein
MPVIAEGEPDANIQPTGVTWTWVHVSFQSMSSTNISTADALNNNKLAVRTKERGQADHKVK